MKSLKHYFDQENTAHRRPVTGDTLAISLREECLLESEIIDHDDDSVTLLVDHRALDLLEQYGALDEKIIDIDGTDVDEYTFDTEEEVAESGLTELAGDPGYKGAPGTALGGTTQPAGAKPVPAKAGSPAPTPGTSTTQPAGVKPMQTGASLKAAQQAAAAGSPAPTPGTSKPVQASSGLTTQMAQSTSGRYGTSTTPKAGGAAKPSAPNYSAAVKSANAAFAANQAKAPQGDQTAGGKTNAAFLPGAAGGATPDAMAGADAGNQTSSGYTAQSQAQKTPDAAATPAPQANALGIQPQANVPQFGAATSAAPASAADGSALGIQPQANNVPQFGAATSAAPAAATSSTSRALPITTSGGPTAATPTSVNPATRGGPAVTGGFGQETNISRDSDDVIAKRGPMGIQRESELEEELNRILHLAGRQVIESRVSNKRMINEADDNMGYLGDIGKRRDPIQSPDLGGGYGPGGARARVEPSLSKPRVTIDQARAARDEQVRAQQDTKPGGRVEILPPGSFGAKLADRLFGEPRPRVEPKLTAPSEPEMRARDPKSGMEKHQDYYQKAMPSDTIGGKIVDKLMGRNLVDKLMGRKDETVKESGDDFARIMHLAGMSRKLDEDDVGHDTVTGIMAERDCEDTVEEAEYQGRKVALGKPMQGDVKKFKVYVKDPTTGNVKKVNFGDKTMRIKKSNPARRKSFRARHRCENPGPKTKARYWSCSKW